MRVMCVDDNWDKGQFPIKNGGPKESEVVTVIGSTTCLHGSFYNLSEYPFPTDWEQENFIPLSDIDETELIKERKERLFEPVIVTLP